MFRKEMNLLKEYVPGKPVEDVMRDYKVTKIVKLASNENPLGPSPLAVQSMTEEIKRVNLYPDGSALELRRALAHKHGANMEQILIGSGGEQIIKLIAQTFINEGEEVIFADPSFGLYEIMSTHIGAKCISIPLTKEFKHDLDTFKSSINYKTKLIYICNPNNPTGNIMTKKEINEFLDVIPKDIVILLDEAYYEYAEFDDAYPDGLEILENRENTIVLRTFSKVSGLAGLRIAYCFSSDKIISQMTKIKGVFNANRVGQFAAIASLKDKEHLEKTLTLNSYSKSKMVNYFKQKQFNYVESHTNFVFVDIGIDSHIINEALLKKGVIIRPGYLWGYDQFIRVSTGTINETEDFIQALDEVLELHL